MIKIDGLRLNLEVDLNTNLEYREIIKDILEHEDIQLMDNFIQHGGTTTLEHSINVSYTGYLWAKKLKLDYKSVARAGLLHDFFLYDWHTTKPKRGIHGFSHPGISLENAEARFELNDLEKDAIKKHMWPLTLIPPKYMESMVVNMSDNYCTFLEILKSKKTYVAKEETA